MPGAFVVSTILAVRQPSAMKGPSGRCLNGEAESQSILHCENALRDDDVDVDHAVGSAILLGMVS